MIIDQYASLEEMQDWARRHMDREPDFVIGPKGSPYMRRWWIIPRNLGGNVYLHEILRSDDDRALHDHPWDSTSYVLEGGYVEHLPGGDQVWRAPGSVIQRKAEDLHRLELLDGQPALSLFFTGPKAMSEDDWAAKAHQIFDPIWKRGYTSRKQAYRHLAHALDMPEYKAHFGRMNEDELRRAIPVVRKMYKQAKRGVLREQSHVRTKG